VIRYCVNCLLPETKPDLSFDTHGVCSACTSFQARGEVDWAARREELVELLAKYRSESETSWDCIVPVSGGKDSTYQVLQLLELGANPLCVTATTCDLSPIGVRNIENIKSLGVDHVGFSPNPLVRARLNRIGLEQVGDISWPEHVGIFTIPVRAAVAYKVPLIVWGENSQNEYGGPAAAAGSPILDRRWLEEFGGLLGLRVSDLPSTSRLRTRDLIPYTYPSDEELRTVGVTGLFLGHFIPWDGYSNALLAQANGFETFSSAIEGSIVSYENLDNHQTGIHDYFKFLKFGFSRATDIASLHIRRGRMTRKQGLRLVQERDGRFPWTYLGKPLAEILRPLDLSIDEFVEICDAFTNFDLFKCDSSGSLIRDRDGSLTKSNYDNLDG
jgi:N-acetyl sugar amidotransferase